MVMTAPSTTSIRKEDFLMRIFAHLPKCNSGLMGLGMSVAASLAIGTGASAQAPPGEAPALGPNRITQADIEAGEYTMREVRRAGMLLFSTQFNKYDGYGDGVFDPFNPDHTSPGNRPLLQNNGTFNRINGLDSQSCLECHGVGSNYVRPMRFTIGGVGSVSAVAMPASTEIDIDDEAGNGFAFYDGRLINPPFLFGAGGVELVGKEMTVELQALKQSAIDNPDTVVPLVAKGVSFGSLFFDSDAGELNLDSVEGVDHDLVVRPFGRKGDNSSIRKFDTGALEFHQGMQPVEVVGEGVDGDGDGVVNEILIGELSAMHVFGVSMERPRETANPSASAISGSGIFSSIGCADCHVPFMDTLTPKLPVSFPEVETDPFLRSNVFVEVDLSQDPPRFRPNGLGGVRVKLFSDLKRHNMGPDLAESTGGELDEFFITPRLWGVRDTSPYLHDGRAMSLTEAIEMHGGEGQASADEFIALTPSEKIDLLAFLRTLVTPRRANGDIIDPIPDFIFDEGESARL